MRDKIGKLFVDGAGKTILVLVLTRVTLINCDGPLGN